MTNVPPIGSRVHGTGVCSQAEYVGDYLGTDDQCRPGKPYARIRTARDGRVKMCEIDSLQLADDPVPYRAEVLRKAEELITGDRNASYGEPTQNFTDIAGMWNVLLRHKLRDGEAIDPGDTAAMMISLKLVRRIASDNPDNWIDAAGYAGCGAEADKASGRIA